MEVLQCDGCDFRAESNDELKAHIQDVHTAFIQPTEVREDDESPRRSRSNSLNSLSPIEDEDDSTSNDFNSMKKDTGINRSFFHFHLFLELHVKFLFHIVAFTYKVNTSEVYKELHIVPLFYLKTPVMFFVSHVCQKLLKCYISNKVLI